MGRILNDNHSELERARDEVDCQAVAVLDADTPCRPVDSRHRLHGVEDDLEGAVSHCVKEERLVRVNRLAQSRADLFGRKVETAGPVWTIGVRQALR